MALHSYCSASYSSCCSLTLCVIIAVKTITIIVWKTIIKYTVFLCFFGCWGTLVVLHSFLLFLNRLTRNRRPQKTVWVNFIAVNFQEFSVFKSIDVWMTMLMNHYSVHLILIASALNTYLVSGVAFISPVNSDDFFVYDHSDACYTTVLALMAALFYKKFLWFCAHSDSTCWSKAHSFFGILGVISGKKPSSNLIKKIMLCKVLIERQPKWLKNECIHFKEYINRWSEVSIHEFRYTCESHIWSTIATCHK